MLQEPFAYGNSWIHQLDPRIRFAAAFFYSVVVALSHNFIALTTAVAISIVLVVLARLPVRQVMKRVIIVNTFTFFLWFVLPLTFQGPPAFTIGSLRVYHPGIIMAAQITLKSNAIILALMALLTTMSIFTMA